MLMQDRKATMNDTKDGAVQAILDDSHHLELCQGVSKYKVH